MILRIITPEGVCEIWKFGKKTNRRAFLVGSMTLVNCSLAIKEADIIYQTPPKIVNIWAKNRPNGIVYGAAGVELKAGVSCASPLPLGTVVEVEGLGEYIVQDRPAQWVIDKYGENQIDIYFDNHEAASAFGLKQLNVYLKGEPEK